MPLITGKTHQLSVRVPHEIYNKIKRFSGKKRGAISEYVNALFVKVLAK
jgi:hypothetical protein